MYACVGGCKWSKNLVVKILPASALKTAATGVGKVTEFPDGTLQMANFLIAVFDPTVDGEPR